MQVGRATHAGRKLAPKGSGKWCCWKMFMEWRNSSGGGGTSETWIMQ
jgi:hypothetical protein